MDPLEVIVTGWIAKDAVGKILGPTAEYLGGEVKNLAAKCNINIGRIFAKTQKRLGSRIDDPGQVHPRVLLGVVSDGAFIEDELAAEYFGGILAASRTDDTDDDRGVSFLSLVRSLSIYQIRLHYLLYRALRAVFRGSMLHLGIPEERTKLRVFIPMAVFQNDIRCSAETLPVVLDHALNGLSRFDLISGDFVFGKTKFVRERWPEAPGPGLILGPTPVGAELYMWAHGQRDVPIARFLDGSLAVDDVIEPLADGIVAVPILEPDVSNRKEIELLRDRTRDFANRTESQLLESGSLAAFPNDLRDSLYRLVEHLLDLNPLQGVMLRREIDRCLNPEDDDGPRERIAQIRSLATRLDSLIERSRTPEMPADPT